MRIKRFNESVNTQQIEAMLLDFKDDDFEVGYDEYEGSIHVSAESKDNIDRVKFIEDVLNLNKRILSLGYEIINDKFHIYTGFINGIPMCRFYIKYKDLNSSSPNKNVESFEDFKKYVEKHLDLTFYEFDTEVYIPDLETHRTGVQLKLDVDTETQNRFVIVFQRGGHNDIQSGIDISDVVMTDDEWAAVNLWSIRESDKERYMQPELQKSAKSKVFGFDKRGIEAIEKCIDALKR